MKKTGHLRTRIGMTIGISYVVFTSLLACIGIFYSYRLIRNEAEEKLKNLIESNAKKLDIMFVEQRILAEETYNFIMTTFDLSKMDNNPDYLNIYEDFIGDFIYRIALKYTSSWFYFNPELDNIGHDVWYTDLNNDGIPERQPEQDISYFEDRTNKEWFFTPKETRREFWTNPYETTIFEDKSIHWLTYSIPVYINDQFIGVTGHDLLFSRFREDFVKLSVFGSGYGILLNDQYQMVIHPDYKNFERLDEIQNGMYKDIFDPVENNESGILRYEWINGHKKIMAFSRLSNNWIMAVAVDEKEIFRQLYGQMRLMGLITALGIMVGALLIFKVTARIISNLEQVSDIISATGNGDYETPIPHHYLTESSEIGILSRAVEEMRIRQKSTFDDIRKYSENLEILVEERTKELENSVMELQTTQKRLVEYKKFRGIHRFLMEIAHRLNTPLGNAGMALSVMEYKLTQLQAIIPESSDPAVPKMTEDILETNDIIYRSIKMSNGIIKGLLSVSKDFDEAEAASVNLLSIIEMSAERFNRAASLSSQPSVDLIVECPDTHIIITYPSLLEESFINLFRNSMKNRSSESESPLVTVHVSLAENRYIISYKDSAEWWDQDSKDRLFEPFSLRPFKNDGEGMEMYMLYQIIKLGLKGEIEIKESEENLPCIIIILPKSIDG